jgi:integrase/recombinase XerD
VRPLAAERTAQISPARITRVGEKENPTVPTASPAPAQLRVGSPNRAQQHVMGEDQFDHRAASIPAGRKAKMLPDLDCQNPSTWLWTLKLLKAPVVLPERPQAVEAGQGDFHLRPVPDARPFLERNLSLLTRWVRSREHSRVHSRERILSIPIKQTETPEVQHIEFAEMKAVLGAIQRSTLDGRRDFALLTLMFNTGARVSEIVGLQAADLRLTTPASLLLRGKGKKQRVCSLWPETAGLMRDLLEEQGIQPDQPRAVFHNHWGGQLTRFGVRLILRKRVAQAAKSSPSLKRKRLHPHSIRHGSAIYLLRSGVDLSTIAHWLGHANINTTHRYLAMDLEAQRQAVQQAKPLVQKGRKSAAWRHDTNLIAWLEQL